MRVIKRLFYWRYRMNGVSAEDIRIGYMNGQYDREGAAEELSDIGADVSVINDWDDELDYYQQNA
jgi:hypothetical protein